jgi:hypothetical protein
MKRAGIDLSTPIRKPENFMKALSFAFFALVIPLLCSQSALAVTEVAHAEQLRARLGLDAYSAVIPSPTMKIAVLDNGFQGYEPGKGLLPDSAELIEGAHNPQAPTAHGLGMAQIIWAVTGKNPQGPKFYLINTNGFSNFKSAVDFVIRNHVDIVLYSQVWPFGDNFDGKGFINAQVNRATSAGILWVNAAGNFHDQVYNGEIASQIGRDHFIHLNEHDSLRFENKLDDNPITLILSWTDFQDSEDYRSNKDLDLFVYDESGKQIASSELIQRGEAPPADQPNSRLSSYSRESISLPALGRGTYQIKVLAKSNNFTSTDRLRILVDADRPGSVVFTDHTTGYEIMPPADNPHVLTIGEASEISSIGPTLDGRVKPDAWIGDATVAFTNGFQSRGSSNAAAIFAGIVAEMKSACGNLSFSALAHFAEQSRTPQASTSDLLPVDPRLVSPLVLANIPAGGQVMLHRNGHLVVLTPVDPLMLPLFKNAYRLNPTDVLFFSFLENRWYGFPLAQEPWIRAPLVEFRLMPTGFWVTPPPAQVCP